jgi:GTPase SAR1 family protein
MHNLLEQSEKSGSAVSTADSSPQLGTISKGRLTLCLVGSGGVGKSSFTIRYLHGHFPEASYCMRSVLKCMAVLLCILLLCTIGI